MLCLISLIDGSLSVSKSLYYIPLYLFTLLWPDWPGKYFLLQHSVFKWYTPYLKCSSYSSTPIYASGFNLNVTVSKRLSQIHFYTLPTHNSLHGTRISTFIALFVSSLNPTMYTQYLKAVPETLKNAIERLSL